MYFSLPSSLYFFFGSFLAYLPFVFPLSSAFICKPSAFVFESTFLTGLLERCHLSSKKIPALCERANKASQNPNSAEVFPTGTSLNSASDAQAERARDLADRKEWIWRKWFLCHKRNSNGVSPRVMRENVTTIQPYENWLMVPSSST